MRPATTGGAHRERGRGQPPRERVNILKFSKYSLSLDAMVKGLLCQRRGNAAGNGRGERSAIIDAAEPRFAMAGAMPAWAAMAGDWRARPAMFYTGACDRQPPGERTESEVGDSRQGSE